uniref:hypothetical protein n=1 Tax=Paenarthrobacter ureafaciens TaxID=37931 RepID=UPI003F4997F4
MTADRPAKDIVAEWHFIDGREPVTARWPEIVPDPRGLFGMGEPGLVIPLLIPAAVKLTDMYQHLAQGTLEFTDADGLARWRRTWRYVPLDPQDDPMDFLNGPKTTHEWKLVELLELPDVD